MMLISNLMRKLIRMMGEKSVVPKIELFFNLIIELITTCFNLKLVVYKLTKQPIVSGYSLSHVSYKVTVYAEELFIFHLPYFFFN